MSETVAVIQSTFVRRNADDDFVSTLEVTSFSGGKDNGAAIQLTLADKYISLTDHDVQSLATALLAWLEGLIGRRETVIGHEAVFSARKAVSLWMCTVCQTVKVVQQPEGMHGQIYCLPCRTHREAREIYNDADTDFFLRPVRV